MSSSRYLFRKGVKLRNFTNTITQQAKKGANIASNVDRPKSLAIIDSIYGSKSHHQGIINGYHYRSLGDHRIAFPSENLNGFSGYYGFSELNRPNIDNPFAQEVVQIDSESFKRAKTAISKISRREWMTLRLEKVLRYQIQQHNDGKNHCFILDVDEGNKSAIYHVIVRQTSPTDWPELRFWSWINVLPRSTDSDDDEDTKDTLCFKGTESGSLFKNQEGFSGYYGFSKLKNWNDNEMTRLNLKGLERAKLAISKINKLQGNNLKLVRVLRYQILQHKGKNHCFMLEDRENVTYHAILRQTTPGESPELSCWSRIHPVPILTNSGSKADWSEVIILLNVCLLAALLPVLILEALLPAV